MKREIEITGEIEGVLEDYIGIRLHICSFDGITDFFAVNTKEKEIITRLNATTKILLNIEHTYEDYMQLIKDLGLEIPSKWKKHWAPKTGECYFYIDSEGEVCPNYFADFGCNEVDRRRRENFNMFPTKKIAEKTINISKLGRLILLWQYTNDCIFEADWKDGDTKKYFIRYDYIKEEVCHGYNVTIPSDTLYFETEEQAEAFIKAYDKEIKKIMGVI